MEPNQLLYTAAPLFWPILCSSPGFRKRNLAHGQKCIDYFLKRVVLEYDDDDEVPRLPASGCCSVFLFLGGRLALQQLLLPHRDKAPATPTPQKKNLY